MAAGNPTFAPGDIRLLPTTEGHIAVSDLHKELIGNRALIGRLGSRQD